MTYGCFAFPHRNPYTGHIMDALGKLFGSPARLKILRLFLFNQETMFVASEICERTGLGKDAVRVELKTLTATTLLRKRRKRVTVQYQVNQSFEYLPALTTFIRETTSVRPREIVAELRRSGALQIVALSGHFTGTSESQIDLLIVGDNLDERILARTVRALEAEFGREVRYASFSTEDFRYRFGVYDRLLRDVFDYPHRLLIDKIGL